MTRTNLVSAYDNRSVVAKLVNMEERISGAESSIEKTVKDGETSIDTKVSTGVTKINSLLTGLDDTIAKAEAAASTAETASTKAETAAKSVDEDIVAANNAVLDAQGYATSGKLHDGTAVTSASNIAKSCETYADTASKAVTQAQASATAAAASQTAAGQNAASAEASAKDASGYLDTVKASADAAATSETNAAASEAKAQAIADSMDVSNMVTMTDEQTITGLKMMTNTSNAIKVASRSSSASSNDVINFYDINTVNGKYNTLIHRTGNETATGIKIMNIVPEREPTDLSILNSTLFNVYLLKNGDRVGMTYYVLLTFATSYGPFTIAVRYTAGNTYNKHTITGYKIINNGLVADSDVVITVHVGNLVNSWHSYDLYVGVTSELSRGYAQLSAISSYYINNNTRYAGTIIVSRPTSSVASSNDSIQVDIPATVITYEEVA